MIYIDSRGCGVGKTTQTIIPRIKQNLAQGIKSLIVVPSINLQHQYHEHLPTATIINSDDSTTSVGVQFNNAVARDDEIIICTHQAFLYNLYISNSYRSTRELIIDEAFDPYSFETITLTDKNKTFFRFQNVFYWESQHAQNICKEIGNHLTPTQDKGEFFEIGVNKPTQTPSLLIGSKQWERLTGPNSRLWGTFNSGQAMINNTAQTSQIIVEVNPSILVGWSSVWIAAAAFEHTFMAQWVFKNNFEARYVYEFEKHKSKLRIHMPTEMFHWTKSLRDSNKSLVNEFIAYVKSNSAGQIIYVNNNDDQDTHVPNGIRINHNAHGINAYKHLTDYAHMSAINPNAMNYLFYKNHLDMTADQIAMAFQAYNTYQLLMRTSLRERTNVKWVNAFLFDTRVALALDYFFDNDVYEYITNISITDPRYEARQQVKSMTRAERDKYYRQMKKQTNKKPPMSPAERMRKSRAKKKGISDNT